MTNGYSPQGWYADPTYPGGVRYWNGVAWTATVSRGGVTFNAAIDPSQATTPPVPGTQVAAPPPSTVGRPTSEYTLPNNDSDGGSTIAMVFGVLAVVFLFVLLIFAINSNDSSSDQPPPETVAPPATEAPAEGG